MTRTLSARELADALGISLATAYRRMAGMREDQDNPDAPRMTTEPVRVGSGARYPAMRVLVTG